MHIFTTRESLRTWRSEQALRGPSLSFVPTMGNLHEGHLKLVKLARLHAPQTLVSLFVNPTQFGPKEDFTTYPRTQQADLDKLRTAGVNAVFAPKDPQEIYPPALARIEIQPPPLAKSLCGRNRPGHFNGVLQVVNKLFNLCQPDVAVFGQKDYQQLILIQQMVLDFFMPITIVSAPTVREASGLAMSSRNQYLDAQAKATAPALYKSLLATATALEAGELDQPQARQAHCAQQITALNSLGFTMQYFEIRQTADLSEFENTVPFNQTGAIVLAAGYLGTTRLIDNVISGHANAAQSPKTHLPGF